MSTAMDQPITIDDLLRSSPTFKAMTDEIERLTAIRERAITDEIERLPLFPVVVHEVTAEIDRQVALDHAGPHRASLEKLGDVKFWRQTSTDETGGVTVSMFAYGPGCRRRMCFSLVSASELEQLRAGVLG